jgi:hypothetical protein
MTKYTILVLNFSIVMLTIASILNSFQIRKLQKRINKIESKIWADNLTETFFMDRICEKINQKRAAKGVDISQPIDKVH